MPGNTTYYFTLEDSTNGQRASSVLSLHINGDLAEGLSSCQVDYDGVTTPPAISSAGGTVTVSTSSTSSSSLSGGIASTSSSLSVTGDSEEGNTASTQAPTVSDKSIKGLQAGVSILVLALIAMIFMQYRLRKRLARLQKGQSTVGRWMNHHDLGFGIVRAKENQGLMGNKNDSREDMRTASPSSNIWGTSETSGRMSQMSAFFEHRSASRMGSATSVHDTAMTNTRRPSSGGNPFGDDAEGLDDDDILHRSASQAKRYSQAESTISDTNTAITSTSNTTGRLSSVAPSDQLSSVGNVSVVSDDHYHRNKAFTIARGAASNGPTGSRNGQFLDPNLALDSRR